MDMQIRTALIDDHPVFRMGLRTAIELDASISVLINTGSPQDALQRASEHTLDIAIVDLVLPEMSGAQFATALLRLQPRCKVLGISMLEEPVRIAEILRAGAVGFVHKTQSPAEILEAIHVVLGGVRYLPTALASEIATLVSSGKWPIDRLTTREREVFSLMIAGCSNDDIAGQLFIARRTVETHRHHVMHKLGARSIVDLVRIALKHGLVET